MRDASADPTRFAKSGARVRGRDRTGAAAGIRPGASQKLGPISQQRRCADCGAMLVDEAIARACGAARKCPGKILARRNSQARRPIKASWPVASPQVGCAWPGTLPMAAADGRRAPLRLLERAQQAAAEEAASNGGTRTARR